MLDDSMEQTRWGRGPLVWQTEMEKLNEALRKHLHRVWDRDPTYKGMAVRRVMQLAENAGCRP